MGLGYSVGMGTGLVVARRESDDSWSPPSAIAALSAGWGLQVCAASPMLLCLCSPCQALDASRTTCIQYHIQVCTPHESRHVCSNPSAKC